MPEMLVFAMHLHVPVSGTLSGTRGVHLQERRLGSPVRLPSRALGMSGHEMERAQPHDEPARPHEPGSHEPGSHEPGPPKQAHSPEPANPDRTDAARTHTNKHSDRGVAERVAAWLVPRRNPTGVVYGLVTVGALLAAESGLRDTYAETVSSAAIAMLLYWFAHSYSDMLGLRLAEQKPFSWQELWQTFGRDWAIARGSSLPLLALLVAWATGAGQATAVAAAVWTVVVSLIAFEVAAGIRSRAKPLELVLEVLAGATMGLAILALRALLH